MNMSMNIEEIERSKYTELWSDVPDYRNHSPGQENVQRFWDIIKPDLGETLIDIGCGTGIAGLNFWRRGLQPRWIDITDAGLSSQVPRELFIKSSLWSNWHHINKMGFDYGFCCDVMEHIPTEYSMLVIDRILSACRTSWFQISLVPDLFGATIDQPLHLTVRPFNWWLERLRLAGNVVDARDLCGMALYVVERK